MKPTTEQIISKLEELEATDEHTYFGVRTQEVPFELGTCDHVSMVWVDGEETEEELDGLSVTAWNGNNVEDIKKHSSEASWDMYFGDYVAIIGYETYEYGEDLGEVIASDPEVVYIF